MIIDTVWQRWRQQNLGAAQMVSLHCKWTRLAHLERAELLQLLHQALVLILELGVSVPALSELRLVLRVLGLESRYLCRACLELRCVLAPQLAC